MALFEPVMQGAKSTAQKLDAGDKMKTIAYAHQVLDQSNETIVSQSRIALDLAEIKTLVG